MSQKGFKSMVNEQQKEQEWLWENRKAKHVFIPKKAQDK